jgi:signal transduction histidine kinase
VPPGGDPAVVSQQLAALKVQLQQELAEIEKQQEAVNASLKPQTIAQVDELLGKMREAIDELEKRKAELAKKK